MASKCPKCHQVVADDDVCCAELKYTWKCKSCGKLSTGFVMPYGRCFMCGGENEVVEGYEADNPAKARIIEEAVQYEVDMYQFYRLARTRTQDETLGSVLEELYHKEEDHLSELEEKYHLHLDRAILNPQKSAEGSLTRWLFEGIQFTNDNDVIGVYDKAIEMERRTRDHFRTRAEELEAGVEKDIFRELAAEEEEHVALLEGEREQFVAERFSYGDEG